MRALVIRPEPAAAIASGRKTLEIRSWRLREPGPLLVVSAGVAVAVVEVGACEPMRPEDAEAACCDYLPGALAWRLRLVSRTEPTPIPKRGQRIFHVPEELIRPAA